jgi:hypothetical protein
VDSQGNAYAVYNTLGMFTGIADHTGRWVAPTAHASSPHSAFAAKTRRGQRAVRASGSAANKQTGAVRLLH